MSNLKYSPDTGGGGGAPTRGASLQGAEIRRSERTGMPRKVRCEIPLPAADTAVDAVRAFLSQHSEELGLRADEKSLQMIQNVSTPVRRVVRYQQCHEGIPLVDRAVVVQIDQAGRVKQMDLTHEPAAGMAARAAAPAADAGGMLSPEAALNAAMRHLGTPVLRMTAGEPHQVYYPAGERLRLAYLALIPTREPAHDWRIIVDAFNAEVLEQRDLLLQANGSGLVFDPNPVVTANNNTFRDPSASTGGCGFAGTPIATIDGQRVTRTLRDITLAAGVHKLEGPFVKMVNFAPPGHLPPTEASASGFTYSSGDPRFEAVNVYYHIDTIQRYIQSLGITTAHNSQIPADAHDNSTGGAFFSPADGGLHFGDSGPCNPDRGEDGDVALHEYGHAIQNDQVPGWGARSPVTGREETRAMGEGFGDILACVFFAEHGGRFQREVFEDWIFGDTGGLRRVDGTKVYPADWVNRVHDDGEIWSAALWNIYLAIGGDSADDQEREDARNALLKTLILSHHLLAADATMPDGAEAVMDTNAELADFRGRHLAEMFDSFHDR